MARAKVRSLSVLVALATMGFATRALAQMPVPPQPYPPVPQGPPPPVPPAQPAPYPQPAPYLQPGPGPVPNAPLPPPVAPAPMPPAPYGQPYPPAPLPPVQPAPYPAPPAPGYGPPPPYTPGPAPMPPPQPYGQPPPYGAPAPYGQPPPYTPPPYAPPPVPYGQPYTPPPPVQPYRDPQKRSDGEMAILYGTTIAYGVGTGIWIDGVAGESDPGLSFIAPILFGGALPVGVYALDHYHPFHRGVPESISTGLLLGAVEGIAVAGTQFATSASGNHWGFGGDATAAWIFSTVGGVGGYAFGEWLRPDSRTLTFIASGGAWGAIAGSEFGAALGSACPSPPDPLMPCSSSGWTNGASIVGIIGYNVGLAATGALSAKFMPSWRSQAWMWGGFLIGTAASSVVYFAYIGSSDDPRHGLIANSLGGLAGLGIAAALTANWKDDNGTNNAAQHGAWKPPFQVSMTPVTSPLYGSTETKGVAMSLSGDF